MSKKSNVINYLVRTGKGLTVSECYQKFHTTELRKIISEVGEMDAYRVVKVHEPNLERGNHIRYYVEVNNAKYPRRPLV